MYKIKNTEPTLNPVFSIYTKYFIVPYFSEMRCNYEGVHETYRLYF